jgi:galactose mutarotase-like enzyme
VLSNGLVGGKTTPLLKNENRLWLRQDLFCNDALIIKEHASKRVSLKSTKSKQTISVAYNDFPYLGIWAKPGGQFVCIEPWLGIADSISSDQDFKSKEGIVCVLAEGSYEASYRIFIED